MFSNTSFVRGERAAVQFLVEGCHDVKFLEHVEVVSNVVYPVRGALEMYLTSPAGR